VICGVDEAGKGSVLGPLVVAGISVSSDERLADLGIRDSKLLAPHERERLYSLIRKRSKVTTVTIHAHEIDVIRREMTMNACVARAHAEVINRLSPSRAFVDACDVNCFRYAEMVRVHLIPEVDIVSEHHADEKFLVVSAASIVAKVVRDRAVAQLGKEWGEIGSGYPSDPVTVRWLTGYIRNNPSPPSIARRSWKTVGTLLAKKSQSTLTDF
jgi:ribonuclease HII